MNTQSTPLSPVDQIVALLIKHNYPNPHDWVHQLHPDTFTTEDENLQRFFINRYWRELIGTFPGNTMEVRFNLVDSGQLHDWLRLFEQGVIPCLLQNTQLRSNS